MSYYCDLCGNRHKTIADAVRCCSDVFDVFDDEELATDGGMDGDAPRLRHPHRGQEGQDSSWKMRLFERLSRDIATDGGQIHSVDSEPIECLSQRDRNEALVSIIIPTYNRPDRLLRAVNSALAQTYDPIEIIIVDDSSEAQCAAAIDGLAGEDARIRVIRHDDNRHVSAARNTGILNAKGEFVAFLDDDDAWLPDKLDCQIARLRDSGDEVGLVYCWMVYDNFKGGARIYSPTDEGYIFDRALAGQPIGNASTLLVRRRVLETVGWFDEALQRGNDGDFIRRVSRDYEVACVPRPLVYYDASDRSDRITRYDREGLEAAIAGQRIKLDKFDDALDERPLTHALILLKIARRQLQLRQIGPASRSLRRASGLALRGVMR